MSAEAQKSTSQSAWVGRNALQPERKHTTVSEPDWLDYMHDCCREARNRCISRELIGDRVESYVLPDPCREESRESGASSSGDVVFDSQTDRRSLGNLGRRWGFPRNS
jgi:hypothetical protein